jgi:hypothetical protein
MKSAIASAASTMALRPAEGLPVIRESDSFAAMLRTERGTALEEIAKVDAIIQSYQGRRDDLQSIVDNCDTMLQVKA